MESQKLVLREHSAQGRRGPNQTVNPHKLRGWKKNRITVVKCVCFSHPCSLHLIASMSQGRLGIFGISCCRWHTLQIFLNFSTYLLLPRVFIYIFAVSTVFLFICLFSCYCIFFYLNNDLQTSHYLPFHWQEPISGLEQRLCSKRSAWRNYSNTKVSTWGSFKTI